MKTPHTTIYPDSSPLIFCSNILKMLSKTHLNNKKTQKNKIMFRNILIRKSKINNNTINSQSNFRPKIYKNISKNNIVWDDKTMGSTHSFHKKYSPNSVNNFSLREYSIKKKKYNICTVKSSMIPICKFISMPSINNNEKKKYKTKNLNKNKEINIKNENIKLKNKLCALKQENKKLKKKIISYKSKINKNKNTPLTLNSICFNKSNNSIDFYSHRNINTESNSLNDYFADLYYSSAKHEKNINQIKNNSADRNNMKGIFSKKILSLYGLKDRTKNYFKYSNNIYVKNSKIKKIKPKLLSNKIELNYITNNNINNSLIKKLMTVNYSINLKKEKLLNNTCKKIILKKFESNRKINTLKSEKLKKNISHCYNLKNRISKLKRFDVSTNQTSSSNGIRNSITDNLHNRMSDIFERTKKLLLAYEKISRNTQCNNKV